MALQRKYHKVYNYNDVVILSYSPVVCCMEEVAKQTRGFRLS